MQDYPDQIDCTWLAVDEQGRLAAMITAGCGPIPDAALSSEVEVTDIERLIHDLRVICDAEVHVKVPEPSSYIALGKRGLFVYDWTDLHRTYAQAINAYELVASPSVCISKAELPAILHAAVVAIDPSAQFGARTVDVRYGVGSGRRELGRKSAISRCPRGAR